MAAATAAASHFEDLRRFVDGSCLNGGLSLSHAVQESAHVAPVQVLKPTDLDPAHCLRIVYCVGNVAWLLCVIMFTVANRTRLPV